MASPLIAAADWPEVRAALDVSLDTTMLPDATIALDAYSGEAMREVIDRDPTAEARTGTAGSRARLAAIYFTAARLAPAIPTIVSESFREARYQRQAVDPEAQAAQLRQRAEEALAAYLEPEAPKGGAVPFVFGIIHGYRGR